MTLESDDVLGNERHTANATDGRGADPARPLPPLADAEAVMRSMLQTYPLLTLTGALLGGYTLARLLRRIR